MAETLEMEIRRLYKEKMAVDYRLKQKQKRMEQRSIKTENTSKRVREDEDEDEEISHKRVRLESGVEVTLNSTSDESSKMEENVNSVSSTIISEERELRNAKLSENQKQESAQRNKKMFGVLLGTLKQFKTQSEKISETVM